MISRPAALLILLTIAFGCSVRTFAQAIPDSTAQKIDSLFRKWNNPNSPGCTVGIVRNDSLIFAKGYGMANLEYAIPNEPTTTYHMASVSKQFTAYAIVLLVKAGKLQLDDDVRKWLPWFPDLKERITIRHLLNHTSGIRDQWQLLAISGTRLDDVITQDHIVKILGRQQALNFMPGEEYSYSNSGYTMAAEIVKSVTGQTLRQFTDSAIFRPLGMNKTHFHDNYTEIEKGRAYSYSRMDNARFSNSILSYSNAGATSLFTNIPDMSRWVMNFYDHVIGDQDAIDMLTQKGKLNNGKELTYALGIVHNTWKGWRQFSHSGGDAGYRTYVAVFPDLRMGFMIFSNIGEFNTSEGVYALASMFIKDTTVQKAKPANAVRQSGEVVLKDTISMKKYLGSYLSEDGLSLSIDIRAGKLYYHINGSSGVLVRISRDSFFVEQAPEVSFLLGTTQKDTVVDIQTPDQHYLLKKYRPGSSPTDEMLKKYTGLYHCPELDCRYGIILKEHQLYLTHEKYNDTKLNLLANDILSNEHWWMNRLSMTRDSKNNITGFEVNTGRIKHLAFVKIK